MNFKNRLSSLTNRRMSGGSLTEKYAAFSSVQRLDSEKFADLKNEPESVRYAIGAMTPVNDSYTKNSFAEGERVANGLQENLKRHGIDIDWKFQGSVPLNIHIKGNSDIDVLVLHSSFITVQTPPLLVGKYFDSADTRPVVERAKELRLKSEDILTKKYYTAKVDTDGAKAISLSGGSLQRDVDIVPAHWHDTHEYQRTGMQHDREVKIYDKDNHTLLGNWPFKHMYMINQKDQTYSGNVKKVCRLLKTLKADSEDSLRIRHLDNISSYEIAGIAYHMDTTLKTSPYFDLALIDAVNSYLKKLVVSPILRDNLVAPDGSRKIFDNSNKVSGLSALSVEVELLARGIFKELKPYSIEDYNSLDINTHVVYM